MTSIFNFSAGPALLPQEVMQQAQQEFIDWQGTGLSVIEISHRSDGFISIAKEAEQSLRDLLAIPKNYQVLFTSGGATFQFSAIPINLLSDKAVYIDTGIWGSKSIKEARKYGDIRIIDGLTQIEQMTSIKSEQLWQLPEKFDYLHYTPNETVNGVEFAVTPDVARGQLVADMSSNILSRPINVSDFALIYAGAQMNIGPAGLGIVIVREDLLERDLLAHAPSILQYKHLAANASMFNTPPTYAWYLSGLVFQWIKKQGGVNEMALRAEKRSQALYKFMDSSDFYANSIHPDARSRMNIPFVLRDDSLNASFVSEADRAGLKFLNGHASVGGMRASLYNAMPFQGVAALIEFMREFEQKNA